MNQIGVGGQQQSSLALLEAIGEREHDLKAINDRLLSSGPESVQARLEDVRRFVVTRLTNLRELWYADLPKARAGLSKHVTEVRMLPEVGDGRGHYVAEGQWNLLGGYQEGSSLAYERIRGIAGGGFEPPTFGL
jgi:hypothetical protein